MDEHLLAEHERSARREPYREAIVVADRLRKALERHGVSLPALRGDFPKLSVPQLHLGFCSGPDAEALARLLEDAPSAVAL